MFSNLPAGVSHLKQLQKLDLAYNDKLESLNSGLTTLTNLMELELCESNALRSPPLEICRQGLRAIKQYYTDIAASSSNKVCLATVVVIGQTGAGKTSLIKTLQSKTKTRILTKRSLAEKQDESTKVFNFEEVKCNDDEALRFIDLGGQEVYHVTYQLTFRRKCIPVIVINMMHFKELSAEIGEREAVRRLYLDWMVHIYLAQPNLGAPKLVLTHKDKFCKHEFESLKERLIATSDAVRDTILDEERSLGIEKFRSVQHLSTKGIPVFPTSNIYEISDREDNFEVFDDIKSALHQECQRHVREVPKLWDDVTNILSQQDDTYQSFGEIFATFKRTHKILPLQLEVILTYMHDCGRLLWYKNIECLHEYVFYNIPAITDLVNVLYDHMISHKWKARLESFQPHRISAGECHRLEVDEYEYLVQKFHETGAISKVLLDYLISVETKFDNEPKLETATNILKSFKLIYGPVKHDADSFYLVPYFSTGYLDETLITNKVIQLVADLVFKGLAPPQYFFHQMASEILELFPSETSTCVVKRNGVAILSDDLVIMFHHDSKSKKVTITIGSDIESVGNAWKHLIEIVNNLIRRVLEVWEGARVVCTHYCPHCMLLHSAHPQKIINPSWCELSRRTAKPALCDAMTKVTCGDEQNIPAALKFPCKIESF